MKILIVTSMTDLFPLITHLLEELERRGTRTEVFYINDLGPTGLAALKPTGLAELGLTGFAAKVAFRVPGLRHYAMLTLLRRRLALLPMNFDAVNIHYADPIYRHLARTLKRHGKKLITTIWGSDFLRAGPSDLQDLGYTLDASDIVTLANPEILRRLIARYPGVSDRARVVRFGMKSLDVITGLQQSESREETRKKLGIPSGKVVVACGYNGKPAQRHIMIADAFAKLPPDVKSRLFALFPMRYNNDLTYLEEVKKSLESTRVEYRILEGEISFEDNCRIRVASDYVVNIQTTDMLSHSLQEHMFAGSSMIVGNWLPYGDFEEMGIPLQKVGSVEEISAALEKAALGGIRGRPRPPYADRLYDYSSWSSNIGKWFEVFDSKDGKGSSLSLVAAGRKVYE
jgi:hypothetical protein